MNFTKELMKCDRVLRFREKVPPENLVRLIHLVDRGAITRNIGKVLLKEMYFTGKSVDEIMME